MVIHGSGASAQLSNESCGCGGIGDLGRGAVVVLSRGLCLSTLFCLTERTIYSIGTVVGVAQRLVPKHTVPNHTSIPPDSTFLTYSSPFLLPSPPPSPAPPVSHLPYTDTDMGRPIIVQSELMWSDLEEGQDGEPSSLKGEFTSVSSRCFRVNNVAAGVHAYVPLIYDDSHFCSTGIMIHSVLSDLRFRNMPSVPVVAAAPSGAVVDKRSRARVLNPTTFAEHIFRPARASAAALQRQRNSGTSIDLRRAGLRGARWLLGARGCMDGRVWLNGSTILVLTPSLSGIPHIGTCVRTLLPVVNRYNPIGVRVLRGTYTII